jgi:mono/diheme cytochrome c family protein
MKTLLTIAGAVIAPLLLLTGYAWSGRYNVGADDPHTPAVRALLDMVRERSIATRAADIQAPDLTSAELISSGAGNYDAMCTGCHLAPGMDQTELSKGLYPTPPDFTKAPVADPARAFWAIKHGIKASGMPAWGKSMDDQYIWGLVAFLQRLPGMNDGEYAAAVAASGGHSHGGGESGLPEDHAHHETTEHGHRAEPEAAPTVHTHADGRQHVHPAEEAPADKPRN